jgi:hypothetical protein
MALWRPLAWTVSVYLQTMDRPRTVTALMLIIVAVLFPGIAVLGKVWGPEGACVGVCVAFMANAVASLIVAARVGAIPLRRLVVGPLRVLAACIPMIVAVLAARAGLTAAGGLRPKIALVVEIAAGALGYGVGVLLFARRLAADLVNAVRDARRAKKAA